MKEREDAMLILELNAEINRLKLSNLARREEAAEQAGEIASLTNKLTESKDGEDAISTELYFSRSKEEEFTKIIANLKISILDHASTVAHLKERIEYLESERTQDRATIARLALEKYEAAEDHHNEKETLDRYTINLEEQNEALKDSLKRANLAAQRSNSLRFNQLTEIRQLEIKAGQAEIIKNLFR